MTVKEASHSEPTAPTTRHTYSPESAGERWGSRSWEPWVCRSEGGAAIRPKCLDRASPQAWLCRRPGILAGSRECGAPANADELHSRNPTHATQPPHRGGNQLRRQFSSRARRKAGCRDSQTVDSSPKKYFLPWGPKQAGVCMRFGVQKATAGQTLPA